MQQVYQDLNLLKIREWVKSRTRLVEEMNLTRWKGKNQRRWGLIVAESKTKRWGVGDVKLWREMERKIPENDTIKQPRENEVGKLDKFGSCDKDL